MDALMVAEGMTDTQRRGWALAQRMSDRQKAVDGHHRPPDARVIEVVEVVFIRGEGIKWDPVRQVTAYYAQDGTFLAERDSWTPPDDEASA